MKITYLVTAVYIAFIILMIYWADIGLLPVTAWSHQLPMSDKLGHFLLIGLLALLFNLSLKCHCWQWKKHSFLSGSSILIIVVVLEEILQFFIPLRTFDWGDLAADFLGIFLFGLLAVQVCRRQATISTG